ncbi:hypothetical protein K435DRAFT_180824 [Dendrothele bispora CBS 962.96]|uniref:Secreted protein n=1 Tax=Dendrothele bispora (strain CBS 962.96) TaxID=1314807 RepID=A0A4S8LWD7_DENBC|nr:hypothetical protein K435DRAFT_180824 [Dendrothele bispora CBS 962.96]
MKFIALFSLSLTHPTGTIPCRRITGSFQDVASSKETSPQNLPKPVQLIVKTDCRASTSFANHGLAGFYAPNIRRHINRRSSLEIVQETLNRRIVHW